MKSYAEQQNEFFVGMASPSLERGDSLEKCCVLAERLINEEVFTETLPALRRYQVNPTTENLVDVADGLVDSVYVLLHTANSLGIPFDLIWDEVHRANMAKLWSDGKSRQREDGKILKPPGWKPPDVFTVLLEYNTEKVMGKEYIRTGMVS
jgi:hypothetical protein